MTRRAWRWWVETLGVAESGAALALVRIFIGAGLVRTVLAPLWAGVGVMMWCDDDAGGYRDLGAGEGLVAALGGPVPEVVLPLAGAAMLGGALVALGVGGPVLARVITFATLQVFSALVDLNGHGGGSYDEVINNALWLLTLAGPTRTLSLECRLRTGRWWSHDTVPAAVRLMVVAQALVMYTSTGWQKLSAHWVPGGPLSALYYILQQPTWQHADLRWVAWVYPVTQVGTFVSWWWEVTAPLWGLAVLAHLGRLDGPFGRWLVRWRVRDAYALTGAVFHLSVAALLDIGSFTWVSLSLYPAFYGGAELMGWGRRWLGVADDRRG